MPEIIHNIETLRELQESLRSVYKDILVPQKGEFEFAVHEIGHRKAADAVESFYGGWNDGRTKVLEGLESMIQSLKVVISAYEETESRLSDSLETAADSVGSGARES